MSRKENCVVSFLEIIQNIAPDANGCKNWPMGISKTGYGVYSIGNFTYSVTRLLYNTIKDGLYQDRLVVRHKCDNRSCCNIDHLEIGTQSQNLMDASKRGRLLFGDKNKMSRLTESQVMEIRSIYPTKSTVELAKIYGTAPGNIRDAINGKTWKHLPGCRRLIRHNPAFGEKSGRRKLSEDQIREIRSKYPEMTGPQLAKEYGVSHRNIYCIIKRRNWTHI